jgi:hypothetical protein
MNEQSIKDEMRLYALECLVCQLYALIYRVLPAGAPELTQKAWRDGARKQTFGKDPALSDLLSAELEIALDRLAEMQNHYLARARPKSDKAP